MEETFAERLKRIRNQRNFTQEQLAEISEIAVQTLRNYEQGISKNPVSEYLLNLAKVLDVTPEYLLLGENNMKTYTDAIKVELMQLDDFNKISEIKNEEFNSSILSHLEMSEELISAITNDWNMKGIFDTRCNRNYVQEVIIKYCQNRTKYKVKFNIQDGMLINSEKKNKIQ